MVREKAIENEDPYPKRLYPGNRSSNSYIRRVDNREESLLGTFIQWIGPSRITADDTKVQPDDADNDVIMGGSKANSINGSSRSSKTTKLLEHVSPSPTNKNKSAQDAHSATDKYRIMYLLVRVEQQQLHLRHVIEGLERLGRPKSETANMVNVLKGITKMHGLLVGLRDNDHVMIKQIGDRNDIEDFLLTVENTCSSVEEIPVPGTRDDKTSRMVNHTTNTMDKMARFVNRTADTIHDKMSRLVNHTSINNNKVAGLVNHTAITDVNMARLVNHTAITNDDKVAQFVKHTKQGDHIKYCHTNNSNQKETIETNTRTQPNLRRRKNTPPNCLDVMLKKLQSLSPAEQEISNTLKDDLQSPVGIKHTAGVVKKQESSTKESSSLPDIDQLSTEGSELNTLMKEIDDLMGDAGLMKDKKENMLSYEVIMLGAGENKRTNNKHKQTNNKHKQPNNKPRGHNKTASQSDVFIEELDKLLDECGSV